MDPYSWETFYTNVLPLVRSFGELPSLFVETFQPHVGVDPLVDSFFAALVFSFITWFLSILTNNYSWVDRLWSLLPPFYVLFFTYRDYQRSQLLDERLALMSAVSTLWGLRLTFNFARKGGYHPSSEDYRWAIVRAAIPEFVFQLFNIVFVALYQNILLWLIAAPQAYFAYLSVKTHPKLVPLDYVAGALVFFLIVLETVADQQQWNFQTGKYRLINEKRPLSGDEKRGFLTKGLFRFSRHPNFFAEISIWFSFYLFTVSSTGQTTWLNWTLVGPVLLLLLFQGSTNFTESISIKKYPQYKDYQKTTSRIIPLWPGKPLPEYQEKKNQ